MSDLGAWPVITEDLPGTGGGIKAKPSHFVVEEIPLYEPLGEGEHVYVRITREGWTTRDLQKALAKLFGLAPSSVGAAGLKDKHARVTQTFSIHLPDPRIEPEEVARKIEKELSVRVEWAKRHTNKLRTGHLRGNRFRVVVVHPEPESMLGRAQRIAEALRKRGVPNYYGEQRFGLEAQNVERGRRVLLGQAHERDRWMRKFLLSAYQAYLFNEWLALRIKRGLFAELLQGDLAQILETGGLFEVRDFEAERPKFEQGEITYTGPIYGWKMRWAEGLPREREREIFAREGLSIELFRRAKLQGSRRPGRLPLKELKLELHPEGLLLEFTLPKGAYATALLREFLC